MGAGVSCVTNFTAGLLEFAIHGLLVPSNARLLLKEQKSTQNKAGVSWSTKDFYC